MLIRLLRGASWLDRARLCRAADRVGYTLDGRLGDLGLRAAGLRAAR